MGPCHQQQSHRWGPSNGPRDPLCLPKREWCTWYQESTWGHCIPLHLLNKLLIPPPPFTPVFFLFIFLAVQNSSIGGLVTDWLTHSLTDSLTDSLTHWRYFYFWHTQSDTRDLWPLKHLIRELRRHDLTEKIVTPETCDKLWPLRHLIRVMRRHDLTQKKTYPPPTYLPTHLPMYLY